jgi:hypothetical protein
MIICYKLKQKKRCKRMHLKKEEEMTRRLMAASMAAVLLFATAIGCGGAKRQEVEAAAAAERAAAASAARKEAYRQKIRRLEEALTRPHRLRKMRVEAVRGRKTRASYATVIFAGRATSRSKEITDYDILFAWEREANEYIISRLPLGKVKFQLYKEKVEPKIQFTFDRGGFFYSTEGCYEKVQRCLGKRLEWATLHISEEDWPTEVSLPLNNGDFKKRR